MRRAIALVAAWLTVAAPVLSYAAPASGPGRADAEICTAQGVQRVAGDAEPSDPAGARHLLTHCDLCVGGTASAVSPTGVALCTDLRAEAAHALLAFMPWHADVLGLPRPRGPPDAFA